MGTWMSRRVGHCPLETVDGGLPPVRAAVVDYPEHPVRAENVIHQL
jgi:hypothetical protein